MESYSGFLFLYHFTTSGAFFRDQREGGKIMNLSRENWYLYTVVLDFLYQLLILLHRYFQKTVANKSRIS